MLRESQFHERGYYKAYLRQKQKEERENQERQAKELHAWADTIANNVRFVITPKEFPESLNTRRGLLTSYGQADISPPLPHFDFTEVEIEIEVPSKKRTRSNINTDRGELYKELAVKYPDGITLDQAENLQIEYPILASIKANSVIQGVSRTIDRVKRQKWMRFE
jgi:hypothetical protein